MKLTYITKADAQARADQLHADMIASSALYAESAVLYDGQHPERGGTARWDVPRLDSGQWIVTVDDRTLPVIPVEASQISEIGGNMEFIRVVRAMPSGVSPIATQAVSWRGLIDWVQPGTPADIPADAIYAAHKDAAGVYRDIVQAPPSFVFGHQFIGWNHDSWPYPT